MKTLSFTQEYFLCALNENGRIPFMKSTEITVCLAASGVLELLFNGCVSINSKKKIEAGKELTTDKSYLEPLFNIIKNGKPMKVEEIAQKYAFSLTNKPINELIQAIGLSMANTGYVSIKSDGGLFKNRTLFLPNSDETLRIVEKVRAEFLEKGEISDETVALSALLYNSGLIKSYFSKYEVNKLKQRLEEIKKSGAASLVKEMVGYIETMIAVLASISGSGI